MSEKKLPSKEEILAKVKELLDEKNFSEAAKLIVYYSVAKIDPEEFARKLVDAAEEFQTKKEQGYVFVKSYSRKKKGGARKVVMVCGYWRKPNLK